MKKIVSGVCILTFSILALIGVVDIKIAHASIYEEESDLVFRKAMEEILSEELVAAEIITVKKEPVFDLSRSQLGFIYKLQYEDKEGFSLVINTDGQFNVTEFYLDAINPYKGYAGQYIYANLMLYLVYIDETFIETESGLVLDNETILALHEKAFSSVAKSFNTGYETIYYTNKNVNKYELTKRHPAYYPTGINITNACVPAAGANVIGYWTRYYPELVPDFTPGSFQLGKYLYKEWAVEADNLLETLFYMMGTNGTEPGTTINEFKGGMNNYIRGKGRNINYTSCVLNGEFDYTSAKKELEKGLPLVLFIDCFRIDEFYDSNNQMSLNYMVADASHAIAGFGYNETTYTLSNGAVRTDSYIQVATGLGNKTKGYYNINYNTTVDECFAILIN